jgi:putative spermidine/putrescine transport system substrate-binding protein
MEDYEAQEHEFWRKLAETDMSRSEMLRRSISAAAGLTSLSTRSLAAPSPPLRGSSLPIETLGARARKEGHLNTIALPAEWANYGEILSTFHKKYGSGVTSANPEGSSEQENQAIVTLKGDATAPDVVDVSPAAAVAGTEAGLYARYVVSDFASIPRSMKGTRGYWCGDYWGTMSIGYNQALVKNAPARWNDLLRPEYKGKVALAGSPVESTAASAAVIAASLASGGSLKNVVPGIDFFATLKKSGNLLPVSATPVTVASGETPIAIDWDYTNLAYASALPSLKWKVVIPADGVYGTYWAQAINANAPHPWTARPVAGVSVLRPRTGAVPRGARPSCSIRRPRMAQAAPAPAAEHAAGGLALSQHDVRKPRSAAGGRRCDRQWLAGEGRRLAQNLQRQVQPVREDPGDAELGEPSHPSLGVDREDEWEQPEPARHLDPAHRDARVAEAGRPGITRRVDRDGETDVLHGVQAGAERAGGLEGCALERDEHVVGAEHPHGARDDVVTAVPIRRLQLDHDRDAVPHQVERVLERGVDAAALGAIVRDHEATVHIGVHVELDEVRAKLDRALEGGQRVLR